MITDILDISEQTKIQGQIIVIGSGIAGSEVALHLARNGQDVILLESGRQEFDPSIQALNDVNFLGKRHRQLNPNAYYHQYLPAQLRGVSRVRQFGGTSNIWTGKWKSFEPLHFEERPWISHSKWPISFDDIIDYYHAVAQDYGFGNLEAEAKRPEIIELREKIAVEGLKLRSFYWEETPTRTRIRFGNEMRRLPNLQVILGATVTELKLDSSHRQVTEVVCRSLEGKELIVTGKSIVLATGAFETARILLASDSQIPGGIGNQSDLVGRFYTDHPKYRNGVLSPGSLTRQYANELQNSPKPRFCICFALDDATQCEYKLLEHFLYLQPMYDHPLKTIWKKFRGTPVCQDDNGYLKGYKVTFVSEQVPQKSSRIKLGEQRDSLGQRKLEVDWRFTELDHRTKALTLDLLTERFKQVGLGTFEFGDKLPTIDNMTDAAHQMGTTKMASSPDQGVVDQNCRVFGTENLYVASSAIFPTGPTYSPTFTILALARRLGQHLLQAEAVNV